MDGRVRTILRWTCVALSLLPATALARQEQGTTMAEDIPKVRIQRLPPSAFKGVPASVTRQLEAEGCTIPQDTFTVGRGPTNLVHGEFARKGQKDWTGLDWTGLDWTGLDWAALCSKEGKSTIEIFWGKTAPCPSRINPTGLGPSEDSGWMQVGINGSFEYSRLVGAVNEAELAGSASPPPAGSIDHQGLEDAFDGKASTVYYCRDGKWMVLAGAD